MSAQHHAAADIARERNPAPSAGVCVSLSSAQYYTVHSVSSLNEDTPQLISYLVTITGIPRNQQYLHI